LLTNLGFTTTDPVNCPINSLELLQNDLPFAGTACIKTNLVGLSVEYANNLHCDLTNLKVKMKSVGSFEKVTNLFSVKVMDCLPLISSTVVAAHTYFVPDVTTINQVFISSPSGPSQYDTADTVNCPITQVLILDSGGAPYAGPCVTDDGATLKSFSYGADECSATGLKLQISAPGGAVHESIPFDIDIRPDCLANMAVPIGLSASYDQNPAVANTVLDLTFVPGSGFTTTDAVYCPITSVTILDSTGFPYVGTCVHVGAVNDTQYGGIFCTETGL
jgi:hypothetical protein